MERDDHDRSERETEQHEQIVELQLQAHLDQKSITTGLDREDRLRDQVTRLQGAALVDRELIAHLQSDRMIEARRTAGLEAALASARRIGCAMGVLMNKYRITDAAAFELLKAVSQTSNRKLRDIAEDVILTGEMPKRS